MVRVSDQNIDVEGMSEYLDQTEVVFAILFGSHARNDADEASDVDIALEFPDTMEPRERFQHRNRIDADLQEYADYFVDVSDIASLPTSVAYAALRDGLVIVGDDATVESYRKDITQEYEDSADERKRERREFVNRLARGDV